MTHSLERYQGDPLSRVQPWLEPDSRKRDAVRAARDHSLETLWSLTEAFHQLHGGGGKSIHTLRTYKNGLKLWLLYCAKQAVAILKPSSDQGSLFIRALEAGSLSKKPLSRASVTAYLSGARAFYKALRWSGATEADPFRDTTPAPDHTAAWDKRQPYSEEAVGKLLEHPDPRLRALVLLGAHGGLRASEMVKLQWNQVQLERGRLEVKGKGGKTRGVQISQSLAKVLLELPKTGKYVIGSSEVAARQRLERACSRVGVDYLGLHALRHSAGTKLLRSGRSLQDVARHLGHASVATAEIYAKWADDSLKKTLLEW
jgi:integrase/recombinase XerC